MNGIALHWRLCSRWRHIPGLFRTMVCAAIRLSALMGLRVIDVMTQD
jgi:transketolase